MLLIWSTVRNTWNRFATNYTFQSKLIMPTEQWFQLRYCNGLRLLFQSEFSHWDLRAGCIGRLVATRHSPRCIKSFSPDRRRESWIIDVPRAGRACGNLPLLDLPPPNGPPCHPFLPRSPESYFVRLTRMDRHNFSANSSIPGRSARKRAWQNTEGGYALARLVCPGHRVSMFLRARGPHRHGSSPRPLNEGVSRGYGFCEPRVCETRTLKFTRY